MAQVTSMRVHAGVLALAIASSVHAGGLPGPGQAVVLGMATAPAAGLRAEGEGRWAEAAKIYREALAREPAQAGLWERLADILATRLAAPAEAADALASAVRYAPSDARLHAKLSQAQAAAGRPAAALAAINRALELKPDDPSHLRARAELAAWNGDSRQALESYERLLALDPDAADADALRLAAARAAARLAEPEATARHYDAYLERQPRDREALLEYMELVAARGDAAALRDIDNRYRKGIDVDQDYLSRVARLYALVDDAAAGAAALEQAARGAADDHAMLYRLAQEHAAQEDPAAAQQAIERALALQPDNLEYLRLRAQLATWHGDYAAALDSYARILALAPDDAGAWLGTARVNYWHGRPREADRAYREYLARQPDVAMAWLEQATVVAEMGDSERAAGLLERYRERFGESEAYRKQKARVLAWAARPDEALALVAALEGSAVDDHELAYTRVVALHHANRPVEALAALAMLEQKQPASREVAELGRYVRTPLRSNVGIGFAYASGSDDVTVGRATVRGELALSPLTKLVARLDRHRVTAERGGGFETVDGDTSADATTAWAGVRHRFSPRVAIDAEVGTASAAGDHFVYGVGADVRPADGWALRLSRRQDLHAVSPRAVDAGIVRRANAIGATWMPDLRHTLVASFQYDTFSDGNDRWGLELAPRRAVVRTAYLNLDLGVAAHWYGFDHDTGNGYYSPTSYRRYAATAMAYWKLGPDNGVALTASLGPYKDNTMSGYRTGGDISATGFFGINRDWFLEVGAGYSDYGGSGGGGYRGSAFELNLTRRF